MFLTTNNFNKYPNKMSMKSTASTKNLAKLFKSEIGTDVHFMLKCKQNRLENCSEVDIFEAAFDDSLSHIRFPTLMAEEYSVCMEKYPGLLAYDLFFDILNYIVAKRPLTCAGHYSTSTRRPKNMSVSLMNSGYFGYFEERENTNKSFISVTATKNC